MKETSRIAGWKTTTGSIRDASVYIAQTGVVGLPGTNLYLEGTILDLFDIFISSPYTACQ
ncbi:MAG: hypothetical protein ACRD4Y_10545 [Candidatus Acidiferrales bacterium]